VTEDALVLPDLDEPLEVLQGLEGRRGEEEG
jgi:hypothetical protein